jgi:GDP-L-fucose synthase
MIRYVLAKQSVYIPGSTGLLGTEVTRIFKSFGYQVIEENSKNLDLRNEDDTERFIRSKKPDGIIFCAAKVGGIGENNSNSQEMFSENYKIQQSVLNAALKFRINKLIYISSASVYPENLSICKEEHIWSGSPSKEHKLYALVKLQGMETIDLFRNKHFLNWISIIPTNLYGINDNWDIRSGHVVASLIKKIVDAKSRSIKSIEIWGDGTATRDFLFASDAAKGIFLAYKQIESVDYSVYNIGSGVETSVFELAKIISKLENFTGSFNFDLSKPVGPKKRRLDVTRFRNFVNWNPEMQIVQGLNHSLNAYKSFKNELKLI